jgi:Ni,Fe-hydrogenase maturation factor
VVTVTQKIDIDSNLGDGFGLEVTHRVRQRPAEEDIEIVDLATAVVAG